MALIYLLIGFILWTAPSFILAFGLFGLDYIHTLNRRNRIILIILIITQAVGGAVGSLVLSELNK